MAKNQGQINLGVNFNVNTKGLNEAKKQIQQLMSMTSKDISAAGGTQWITGNNNFNQGLSKMKEELKHLEQALEKAYNPKLGTYEITKFNQAINTTDHNVKSVMSALQGMGIGGQQLALSLTTEFLAVNRAAKQVDSTVKKLGDTMMNTIRWSITSSVVNTITQTISNAYNYTLKLDKSLNDIRVVTGKSAQDMENFARQANKAAKALGASTTDYTDASLIYYQQGLSDAEVRARTETTLKVAAITDQSASAASEQLTAVWNGYKVNAKEAEIYIDKLSAVAADSAADLEELSTGMSKVASAANIMGVDVDQLNAQLATIVSVTREAPESIGTALKTVYARMSDIEAGLDTETTLGEYTSQMAQMGINVLDTNGNLRDMGAVIEEIGGKWNSLNREQQVSLSQSIAGTRQYSRMMALFDNWGMYQKELTTSIESVGTLNRQHATYLQSTEAHMNKLTASAQGLYDSIFNSEDINTFYSVLSKIVTGVDHLVQSIGGLPGILTGALALLTKFSKSNIAEFAARRNINRINKNANKRQIESGLDFIKESEAQIKEDDQKQINIQEDASKKIKDAEKEKINAQTKIDKLNSKYAIGDVHPIQEEEIQKQIKEQKETIVNQDKIINQERNRLELSKQAQIEQKKNNEQRAKTLELEKQVYEAAQKGIISNERWNETQAIIAEVNSKYEELLAIQARLKELELSKGDIDYSRVQLSSRKDRGAYNLLEETGRTSALRDITEQESKILAGESKGSLLRNKAKLENRISEGESQKKSTKQGSKENKKAVQDIAKAYKELEQIQKRLLALDALEEDKKRVKAAEEYVAEREKALNIETKLKREIEEGDALLKDTADTIDAMTKGEKIATIAESAASALMSVVALSQATGEITTMFANGEVNLEGIIESLLGIGMTAVGLIPIFTTLKKQVEGAFWPILIVTASLGALMMVLSAISAANQAKIDAKKETIKAAQETQKEAKANLELISSYEKLYEAYQESGEVTKELEEAARALIEQYNIENGEILLLTKNYDDLTEAIKRKKAIELSDLKDAAKTEQETAERRMSENIKGVTDTKNATGGYDISFGGRGKDEGGNLAVLKAAIERVEGATLLDTGSGNYVISTESPSAFAHLYGALSEAYSKMKNQESSEIAKNVKQMLDSESFSAASESYLSSSRTFAELNAREKINKTNYENKSIADLRAERETLKAELVKQGVSEEEALSIIDAEYANLSGNAAELSRRLQYSNLLNQKQVKNIDDSYLTNLSNIEFTALMQLDPLDYQNDLNKMLEDVDEQVQKIRDEAWAGLSEERLAALDKELTRLERVGSGKNLKDQVEVLFKQAKILEGAAQVAKNTFGDTVQTFFKDASKNGVLGQLDDDLNQLIANGKWENLREKIEDLNIENEDAKQNLLDNITKMMTASNDLADVEKQIFENEEAYYEKRIESLEKVGEAYEKQIDYLEGINSLLDHQKSLIELIHGENAAGELENYFSSSLSNAQTISESYKQSLAYWTGQRNRTDTTEEEKALIEENWKEAADAYASSIIEIANIAKEQYSNTIESLIQSFNQELLPSGRTTTGLGEEWDWVKKQHSDYLSPLDRAFGMDEIRANYQAAINDSSNIKAQQKINDLMQEQLDILESQDKLSQYDLDRANKKLEILQAEIALQEAQDAKTQMRLTRSANGTYSYQYVADESAIDKAQENLKKANQSLYQLDIEAYQENLDEFYSLYQEYQDKVREYSEDGKITEEERNIIDRYKVELAELAEKNGTIQINLQDSIKESAKVLGEDAQSMVAKMQSVMNTGMQQLITKFGEDNGEVQGKFDTLIDNIDTKAKAAFGEEGTVTKAFKILNDLLSGEDGVIANYEDLANKFANDASIYSTQASEVSTLAGSYKTLADNIQLTIDKIASLKELSKIPSSSGADVDNSGGDLQSTFAWNGWINSKQNSLTNDIAVEVKSRGTPYKIYDTNGNAIEINNDELNNHHFHLHGNPDGNGIQSYTFNGQTYAKGTMLKTNGSTGEISGLVDYGGTYYVPLENLNQLNGRAWYEFDTGGYTGDWHSSEGRLAMLHEKELILKKEDTTNFLDALEILRSLNLSMLNNLTSLNTIRTPSAVDSLSSVTPIEQNVTIHAEFPDATDAQEIKEAFEELVNLATQRAFEK